MWKRFTLLALILLLACAALPTITQHHIQHHNPIRIQIDDRFNVYEHRQFIKAFSHLSHLNLRFVEVSEYPDLRIKWWSNPVITSRTIGLHYAGQNYVLISTDRIATEAQMRAVVLHETGHWLGMTHVCRDEQHNSVKYHCSPVGYGMGIMNPVIGRTHVQEFTDLDIQEFRRAMREGPLL